MAKAASTGLSSCLLLALNKAMARSVGESGGNKRKLFARAAELDKRQILIIDIVLRIVAVLRSDRVRTDLGSALHQAHGLLGGLGGHTVLHNSEGSGEGCELVLAHLRALILPPSTVCRFS